jgi:hypothetical protein
MGTARRLAGIYRGGTEEREQLQGDRQSTDTPAVCKISTKQKTTYIYLFYSKPTHALFLTHIYLHLKHKHC